MIEYQISSAGLSNPANSNLPQDFKFVVGKKEYFCNSFQADFISSKIAELHLQDQKVDTFYIDLDDKFNAFELIMKMMNGEEVEIPHFQIQFIRQIAKIIGNEELIDKFTYVDKKFDEMTYQQTVQTLEEKNELGMDCSSEIEYIAKSFYDIDNTIMDCMDIKLLDQIFASPSLVLDDETKTFQFICRQITQYSRDYISLLKYILYQNLSPSDLEQFCSIVDFENGMTPEIFAKVKERLEQNLITKPSLLQSRYDTGFINCEYKGDKKNLFNGIFAYLKRTHITPTKQKIIIATSSGETSNSNAESLISNENQKNIFEMSENPTSYLCVQFTDFRVIINGYSFASPKNGHWDRPQSWVIEGSNNGKNWSVIDKQYQNQEMGGNDKSHLWTCKQSNPYHYIRWRLTEKGTETVGISQYELFGLIKQHKKKN